MRMFAFIGNRQDVGSRILELTPSVLTARAPAGEPLGWGIGFYQAGEILLRRRPLDDRAVIDLVEVTRGVRSDLLIGHVRLPTIGGLRTENTHPFRYRQWMLAQTGTIPHFDQLRERMLDSQPEFLRRNVRGDTDTECFFYLVLSFLHDAGHLASDQVAPAHVRQALRSAMSLVDRLTQEAGAPAARGDVLLTDGEHLFAVHRGGDMGLFRIEGRAELEQLLGDAEPGAAGHASSSFGSASLASLDNARFYVLSSGVAPLDASWERIPEDTLVTLSRTEAPEFEPL